MKPPSKKYQATGARLRELARTFDRRRSYATMIDIRPEDWAVQQMLEASYPEMKTNRSGGILGKVDAMNAGRGSGYKKFHLRYWSRRQLYNRHKWLKGELSRLILKQKVCTSNEERLALILKRRKQIEMYASALAYYKPLHDAVRIERKASAKVKKRQQAKKAKRKVELKAALARC